VPESYRKAESTNRTEPTTHIIQIQFEIKAKRKSKALEFDMSFTTIKQQAV